MNRLFATVGMCGSGKSIACDFLRDLDWIYIRFGQLTIDKLREEGKEITPENEKTMREELRKKFGMGAFALLTLPTIETALVKGNVVIDGLYSWSEYKILKAKFPDKLKIVHIYASPKVRYERLSRRSHNREDKDHRMRILTPPMARRRDYAEIENIEKGGPIAMADHTIINESTVDFLKERIMELVHPTWPIAGL